MSGSVDLVFEGGGVKGVGLAGAYGALEEEGWEPECVAGASAGAITAALVAAGYTGAELREEVLALQFGQFKDEGWEDRLPVIGREISVLRDFGVFEGRRFLQWMTEKLDRKGVRTFSDLKPTGSDDPKRAFRLQVIASDVTRREMLVLPRDAQKIGSTAATLSIAYAVRMSMSIPIFFEPVRHSNDSTGLEHLIVDGGMLSNFPVWLFDVEDRDPVRPTFGFRLTGGRGYDGRLERMLAPLGRPAKLGSDIFHTSMEVWDKRFLSHSTRVRTCPVPAGDTGTADFRLTSLEQTELVENGRRAAQRFLDSFNPQDYRNTYGRRLSTAVTA
jgi:NTE family protein